MFDSLSTRIESALSKIMGRSRLSAGDVDGVLTEIKNALLDGDVNLKVAENFCSNIREKAVGTDLLKSLTPEQGVIKCVYEELVSALGVHTPIDLRCEPPVVIMVVGLQGSGKTTSCGKLARYFKEELGRNPAVTSADIYRPAAISQLQTVAKQAGVGFIPSTVDESPLIIAKRGIEVAKKSGFDVLIIDTAGRLQIDKKLMDELADIAADVEPHEILFVADAMTGQEAANVAKGFDERLDLDGVILTKMDGDARGGAALSIKYAIGKPIKFVGVGEKINQLEPFYPDRTASRILGMGDVVGLIEKAQKQFSLDDTSNLQKKFKKDQFTLTDFVEQLRGIQKMGSIGSLMGMLPGMGKMANGIDEEKMEKELKRVEAIILSMTPKERDNYEMIDGNRKKRIAKGSGTSVEQVNGLLNQFGMMRKMMKKLTNLGPNGIRGLGGLKGLSGMFGR